jgi:hypothetical protein
MKIQDRSLVRQAQIPQSIVLQIHLMALQNKLTRQNLPTQFRAANRTWLDLKQVGHWK